MNPLELKVGDTIRYPKGEREDEKVISIDYSIQRARLVRIETGSIHGHSFMSISKLAGVNLSARNRKLELWKGMKGS